MTPAQRLELLRCEYANPERNLALETLAGLLGIRRTSLYYAPSPPDEFELTAKAAIDRLHTDNPAWGSRQLAKQLCNDGISIGRLKVRRYMAEMGIKAIYPLPSPSKAAQQSKRFPYLLRNFVATRPNQVWSIDITYIRLQHGFVYLTAIIDWYSRCIVGWSMDDTLGTAMVLRAVESAFRIAKPQILNSDQGSQFTSEAYIQRIHHENVTISMDGKGRWADNIPIERWFRTLKYEEVYLKEYYNLKEARQEIGAFIHNYNWKRLHSALDYSTPSENYYPLLVKMLLEEQEASAILDRAS